MSSTVVSPVPATGVKKFPKKHHPSKQRAIEVKPSHPGFFNKGNTCYANAILQAISTFPALWSQGISSRIVSSSLTRSVSSLMTLMQRSSTTIDPSNFLRALQVIKTQTDPTFNFNNQHDVPEILDIVLDELVGVSSLARNLISIKIRYTKTCDTCFFSYTTENSESILRIPIANSVQASLDFFLKDEALCGNNQWFCPICDKLSDSTLETKFSSCGQFFIVQLKRFSFEEGVKKKDHTLVQCLPPTDSTSPEFLKIPEIVEDDVSFYSGYSLLATINHSGNSEKGHYIAYIRQSKTNSWLLCDDTKISNVRASALNNSSSYILIYERR